jgi:hypothetical protein
MLLDAIAWNPKFDELFMSKGSCPIPAQLTLLLHKIPAVSSPKF